MGGNMRHLHYATLISLLISTTSSKATTIVVAGACTFGDAVIAGNTNTAVGGCAAGEGRGADVIELYGDIELDDSINATSTIDIVGMVQTPSRLFDGSGRGIELFVGPNAVVSFRHVTFESFQFESFQRIEVAAQGELVVVDAFIDRTSQPIEVSGDLSLQTVRVSGGSGTQGGLRVKMAGVPHWIGPSSMAIRS